MAWSSWNAAAAILYILLVIWRQRISGLAPPRPSSTRLFNGKVDVEVDIKIRDCKYGELNPVSDLVVRCFYDNPRGAWKRHLYQLAELNRLQQNFPYADQGRHRMLVANAVLCDAVVGFCDVDNRPASPNIQYKCNPRPILSDLLVSPDFRRQGIGRKLVEFCESTCRNEFRRQELYVRVLEGNEPARAMYSSLGYEIVQNPGDPDEVILMRKDLTTSDFP